MHPLACRPVMVSLDTPVHNSNIIELTFYPILIHYYYLL